jgi:HlyD family secretion protein
MKRRKKILFGGIALAAVVAVILWLTVFHKSVNAEVQYKTDAVSRGDIEALVVASGTLNPVDLIDVGTQVSGRISKIYVDFNSPVKAGQVVAELEQDTYITRLQQNQANYKTAVASLDKARVTEESSKRSYDRALSLFDKQLISFEEKDAAETAYLNAKADVKSAEARVDQAKSQVDASQVDLNYTIIKSPIDGVVISRQINVGQTVASSFQAPVLFQVANDLSKMQVECSIDEADIGKVKEGQQVRFTVDAFPNESFRGEVKQVRYSPTVTSNVVTYTAIVTVSNPELKLRPGMTATASILTGEARDALKIPNAALRFTPDLPAEEMQAIMKKAFESLRAELGLPAQGQGQSQGQAQQADGPGVSHASTSQPATGGLSSGAFQAGQGTRMGQAGRRPQMSRVWTLDKSGQLVPIFIRTGVTDNSYTQIVWGNLKEGQELITGMDETGNPFARRGMRMFMR